MLDRYEGFDPASPEAGEFARSVTEVFVPESDRPRMAQAYFYVPSIDGKALIPSGDYLSHRGGLPGPSALGGPPRQRNRQVRACSWT